jgi:hypothetical protein
MGSATSAEMDIIKFTHHAVEAPFTTPGGHQMVLTHMDLISGTVLNIYP